MRLTIKGTGLIDCGGTVADLGKEEYSRRYHEKAASAHIKLGELEDIEDELGIDLTTLFKAAGRNGFYTKDGRHLSAYLALTQKAFVKERYDGVDFFYFSDYGKTWALTKEELQ